MRLEKNADPGIGGTRLARVGPQISIWNAVCCLTHVSSQSSLSVMRALHKGSKNALPLPATRWPPGKKKLRAVAISSPPAPRRLGVTR